MRLLLDECVPRKLKFFFTDAGHECETVTDAGFSGKENGELLALADKEFDVLITVDPVAKDIPGSDSGAFKRPR
jgi:predicted nuclease of predicted toxin-antitoxin system